jgi:glutamyl-tRNA reductase
VKQREGESYEDWAKRVQMYEHGWAMQRIAEGNTVDSVLEDMSKRITQKLLHPLYKEISKSIISTYDAEAGKKEYEEKYLKYRTPVADHVEGQLFDKPE